MKQQEVKVMRRTALTCRDVSSTIIRMVEIPDPLPRDVDALHKLARELMRDIQEMKDKSLSMQRLIDKLETLVEAKERGARGSK